MKLSRNKGSSAQQPSNWVKKDLWVTRLLPVKEARLLQQAYRDGRVQRIREGIYTAHQPERWPELIRTYRFDVAAALFPDAIVGWRTAFEGGQVVDDAIFLTYGYTRTVEVAGLTFIAIKGPPAQASDMPYLSHSLRWASYPRVLLENIAVSRGLPRRSAGLAAVTQRLDSLLATRGEKELNGLRDQAAAIAEPLGMQRELAILQEIVSRLLVTHPAQRTSTAGPAGPADTRRIELFDVLAGFLASASLPHVPAVESTDTAIRNFALLESYFSNYIEGTRFTVEEAIDIGINGNLPLSRPKDAHDILGVMLVAQNPSLRQTVMPFGPTAPSALEELHLTVMRNRPEAEPGKFKLKPNMAGNTTFVLPELARGTLIEGSKRLALVPEGLARALMAMFIVAEVHPFTDGNGRISRLVMNNELTRTSLCRILVPTLAREEYVDCLRVMTRSANPKPYVDFMVRLQRWSASYDYRDLEAVISAMRLCHAMEENPVQYKLLFPAP